MLPKRFDRYGLTLHPEDPAPALQTAGPDATSVATAGNDPPAGPLTFDFLGFTIHWGKSRTGKWVVRERTANDRFRGALHRLAEWCRLHRHAPLDEQQKVLNAKLLGHYGYFGRRNNRGRIWDFLRVATRGWWRALRRRSQRGLSWAAMYRLLQRYPLLTPAQWRPA